MVISFRIPGRLAGKSRPRFVRATGRTYTDKKTASHVAIVRQFGGVAAIGHSLIEGPCKLSVTVRINYPMSWSKKRKQQTIFVTGKLDCDNIAKLVIDGLNGIIFRDDSQIAQIEFDRRYQDGPEYVDIRVEDLSDVQRAWNYSYSETRAPAPIKAQEVGA